MVLASAAVAQESPAIGWTLLDQFDKPYTATSDLKVLLIAHDMAGSKLVKAALADRPEGYLDARHAAFVADISRMPAPISKLFAVPAMRDYAYRVLLDREPRVANRFPATVDAVTWLQLEQGKVVATRSYDSADALRQALERGAP
ncbi:FAD/FMN-containing dehydrogenase [Pseudomonas sp. PDNC002]|uniref:FAD/FMN-containing dehydrogenase n=1 Tax=Pseudomonas sp. PDNC002 TaxID=2811422 RepID=UPI0019627BCC|nr:FAD/FMN-containing dehydrogenase [Pseudomonas sp. PDNC002]QRY82386.1 FAD/FMN-containing dehydrogenase [Pseudomonas sp. PDNC002]